jgi:hypothetical protein
MTEAVNNGPNTASRPGRRSGSGSDVPGSIGRTPGFIGVFSTLVSPIMENVPDTPDQQIRTVVTRRIIGVPHVRRSWPRLGEAIVRHCGQLCYVSAVQPGHRQPTPILCLRY